MIFLLFKKDIFLKLHTSMCVWGCVAAVLAQQTKLTTTWLEKMKEKGL